MVDVLSGEVVESALNAGKVGRVNVKIRPLGFNIYKK